jgi:hypothetical protein
MAFFEEHLGWALGGGIILASMGLHAHHLQPIEGMVVVALAGIGGSIPDMDLNKTGKKNNKKPVETGSKPFRYFTLLLSLAVPILFLYHLNPKIGEDLWTNISLYIIFSTLIYRSIRSFLKSTTSHRGVMHSIPFAFLCAEVTYLIFVSDYSLFEYASKKMPEYFASAVFVGYLTHLLADEYCTVKWDKKKKKITKNQYFGTAFTLYSHKRSTPEANLVLYFLVIMLFFAIQSQKVSLQTFLTMLFTPQ